jgi:drug/metabolite transporter (DMT)-like permease
LSDAQYLKGALFGIAMAAIAASWSAVTRLAVTTNLGPWDIATLRFGVAGLLLFPVLLRRGLALDRLGWTGLAAIVIGGGVPYVLLAAYGLHFAPASDQGALNPGCTPLFVALIAAMVSDEKLSATRVLGLALILVGALLTVFQHVAAWNALRCLGDAFFLGAGLLWACFTVTMRWAKLDPLHAAALVSTGSAVICLPVSFAWHAGHLTQTPLGEIALQAIFQGIMVTIVALLFYGRAIASLGASGGAAFLALVPALSALLAIPLLDEWPSPTDWLGIGLISAGVYATSGGWRLFTSPALRAGESPHPGFDP